MIYISIIQDIVFTEKILTAMIADKYISNAMEKQKIQSQRECPRFIFEKLQTL